MRRHVLGADRPDIGDLAVAEMRERFGRDVGQSRRGRHSLFMALDSSYLSTLSSPARFHHSWSVIAIVLTTRSGSGRARSIDSNPFFKSAPNTSMPSASTKVRWNWRAAMPRWRYCRALSSCCRPRMHELVLLDGHVELVAGEARDRQRDAQPFGPAVLTGDPLDVVGRIAVGGLGDAIERTLDLVEAEQEGTRKRRNSRHDLKVL